MSDNLIKASAAAKQLGKSSTTIRREYTIVGECRHGLDAFFERYNIIEGNISLWTITIRGKYILIRLGCQ